MSDVPDFTDSEQELINRMLKERYGKDLEHQLADGCQFFAMARSGLTPVERIMMSSVST